MPAEQRIPDLRVAGLVKRYSSTVSVGPISFDVYPGEYLSLLAGYRFLLVLVAVCYLLAIATRGLRDGKVA